ncbi:MAG: DUF4037 domain-containing protein [Lachnospiraceae bacterium]|nr:DUF4037 domain-containing protein [Lachnospiraceae bacterium]
MKGLELSRAYYETFGAPMLEREFPEVLQHAAVGLVGQGSECLGYDDEVSQDHDFEPGFCIFLPSEEVVDRRSAFLLERAYAKLPDTFMGYRRNILSPVGGNRHGVLRLEQFLKERLGVVWPDVNAWMQIPEQGFVEVLSGELFRDDSGEFTRLRRYLSKMPEDVRRKKLAGQLLLMAQSGEYNYIRCLKHGEPGAAQLAVTEFCRAAMHAAFLLNGRYMPYYKWQFRALRALPKLSETAEPLLRMLTTGNGSAEAEVKIRDGRLVARMIIDEMKAQGLPEGDPAEMEPLAYALNDTITDGWIRNLHILYAV